MFSKCSVLCSSQITNTFLSIIIIFINVDFFYTCHWTIKCRMPKPTTSVCLKPTSPSSEGEVWGQLYSPAKIFVPLAWGMAIFNPPVNTHCLMYIWRGYQSHTEDCLYLGSTTSQLRGTALGSGQILAHYVASYCLMWNYQIMHHSLLEEITSTPNSKGQGFFCPIDRLTAFRFTLTAHRSQVTVCTLFCWCRAARVLISVPLQAQHVHTSVATVHVNTCSVITSDGQIPIMTGI